MVKEIENDIYRIRTTNRTFLIEITSVSQILENSNATPKIAVLSNQKYKKRVRELIAKQKGLC